MQIWAHTLVKNEDRFLWFSVTSVIAHVDKMLLWDTGSTDGTKAVVNELMKQYPTKIEFKEVGDISVDRFPKVRQQMLDATNADWFLVVDGDEIWWDESIKKVVRAIKKGKDLDGIFVPTVNLVGDMYHSQEYAAGRYNIKGKVGHLAIRAINRKIPGLASKNPHGTWGWVDNTGKMVQERTRIEFVDAPYIHTTFLRRSSSLSHAKKVPKRYKKLKYEIGNELPIDFYYPESFFRNRPSFVQSPWEVMTPSFKFAAGFQTPLKMLKRRILPARVGY